MVGMQSAKGEHSCREPGTKKTHTDIVVKMYDCFCKLSKLKQAPGDHCSRIADNIAYQEDVDILVVAQYTFCMRIR